MEMMKELLYGSLHEIRPEVRSYDRARKDPDAFLRNEVGSCNTSRWQRFNSHWFISKAGDLLHVSGYQIGAGRLSEPDWILHLEEKIWFDANTFMPAYFAALRMTDRSSITIKTAY